MKKVKSMTVLAILGTIMIVLMLCIVNWFSYNKSRDESQLLADNWTVQINDKLYENVDLRSFDFKSVDQGDTVVLGRNLPKITKKQPALILYSIHAAVTVQIDGKNIYKYGNDRFDARKVVGYGYNVIPISISDQNHYLSIKMDVSEFDAFTSIVSPKIVEATRFIPDFIMHNAWEIIISLYLVVFGAIIILFAFGLALGRNKKINLWKLMWLGAFTFFAGLYSMCATDIIMLFTTKNLLRAYLEFETLYMIPVCFTGYIYEEVKYGKKMLRRVLYDFLIFIQTCFWFTLLLGEYTNRFHPSAMLPYNHLIDVLVVSYGIIVYYYDWKRHEGKTNWLLFGMLVLAVFAMEEVTRFNYEKYIHPSELGYFKNYLYLAAFIFSVSLLVDYVSDVIYVLYNSAKVRMVEEFAYVDTLTRVGNRHATEEFYDEVDKLKQDYCLIEFDLNNLKVVNDTYGHEAGDFYIKSFANALKRALDGSGFIGRTGGDEFVAVLTSPHCLEPSYVDSKLRALEKEIEIQNSIHEDWNMSVASGYCYSDEAGIKNIRNAFRVADSRMYVNKRNMKASR
jgi:diguanylate cyclase (GGDEF)-like protein